MEIPKLSDKASRSLGTLLGSLKKDDGSALLTKDQAAALANIKLSNGESLLLPEDRYFLLEVSNMVNKLGYEKTYEYLNNGGKEKWDEKLGGFKDLRKKILFLSPLMQPARDKAQIDMEIYRNKPDVVVGGENCPKCGSEETISVEKQMKKCDEPANVYVTCLFCSYKWRAQ